MAIKRNVARKAISNLGWVLNSLREITKLKLFLYDPNDKSYKELAPVNVAIQLGDGGLGIITELNAFYNFTPTISIYGNFFYLISPKDVNGVTNWPPGDFFPQMSLTLYHEATYDVNSVPDNYTMRGGANFTLIDWYLPLVSVMKERLRMI